MKHRLAFVLPMYLLLYAGCFYASYLLRFDFSLPVEAVGLFWSGLPILLILKSVAGIVTGEWRHSFRYATLNAMFAIVCNAGLAATAFYVLNSLVLAQPIVPRSVILIDFVLTVLSTELLRILVRFYGEIVKPMFGRRLKKRSLIYGTNRAAIAILRAMQAADSEFHVVGFIDDDTTYRGSLICGIKVYSTEMGWSELARKLQVEHVMIPNLAAGDYLLPGKSCRKVIENCARAGLKPHSIPAVDELVDGRYRVTVRDVTISDLLRREPADLDLDGIRLSLSDRRILVTGGAGSIGSELCRQILALGPASLTVLDQSEFGIFTIQSELEQHTGADINFVVADVTNETAMQRIMMEHRPQVVFHAAAYKHVPIMEAHPQEAIRNNVFGTKNVADLAARFGVEAFVLISTDKAVHPSSIMGATKFVAEKYLQFSSLNSKTRFMTVRFGNVLDSAGSVVPIFRQQIARGGPITVTHPDIERFFMTIPEAVQLVLQAAAIGDSGDILILEMGEPVKIVDLAKDMIYLSGLRYPDDINIRYTGLRPGEKLTEELFYSAEDGTRKVHDKIFCANCKPHQFSSFERDLVVLESAVNGAKIEAAHALMQVVARHIEAAEQRPAVPRRAAA